jgi:hypothetical protein
VFEIGVKRSFENEGMLMLNKESNNIFKNPALWYVVSIVVIFAIFVIFFFRRFTYDLEAPVENWVNTASYFNGILTPPLLAITSILIFLTWKTSQRELKATKEILEEQLENQIKKDDLESIIRQSENLDNRFSKTNKVIDIISLDLIFNILEIFIDLSERELLIYCKNISSEDFKNIKTKESAISFLRGYILNLQFTKYSLATIGDSIQWKDCNESDGGTKAFLLQSFKRQSKSPTRDIIDVLGVLFYLNLKKQSEVKSFDYLIEKIHNSKSDYKTDLIEEFKLNFNSELADILIKLNNTVPDDMLRTTYHSM